MILETISSRVLSSFALSCKVKKLKYNKKFDRTETGIRLISFYLEKQNVVERLKFISVESSELIFLVTRLNKFKNVTR